MSVIEEAATTVADRSNTHGEADESLGMVADMWTAYFGTDVRPHEVAEAMVLLKVARSQCGDTERDHHVDICGYAHLASEVSGA